MTKQAIAITHVVFEDAGLLTGVLAARGVGLATHPAWEMPDEAAEAPLVILLGGPISANDTAAYPFLKDEIALTERRMADGLPTLGICLGAQIMARAIGGTVGPGDRTEIGWAPVELTAAGRASVLAPLDGRPVLHWHGEACTLPEGIESLAATPACPAQAFVPAPGALALQFHAEAGAAGIEPWLVGHAVEIAATAGVDVPGLRADTARHGPALARAARAMFQGWLDQVGVAP